MVSEPLRDLKFIGHRAILINKITWVRKILRSSQYVLLKKSLSQVKNSLSKHGCLEKEIHFAHSRNFFFTNSPVYKFTNGQTNEALLPNHPHLTCAVLSFQVTTLPGSQRTQILSSLIHLK